MSSQRMPDVSVVTISFNQAAFLAQAIESVVTQQGVDLEYIVVDPGSNDGSREIIERFRSSIAHAVLEPDNGPGDGLNKGFRLARGRTLHYLNSDDLLQPGALAFASNYLDRHRDVDVIVGNGHVIDAHGTKLRRNYSDRFSLRSVAYDACVSVQPSTFFRREAFARTAGFNNSNRSNWDGELLVDMALAGARFARVDRMLSCHRMHDASISGSLTLVDAHREYKRRMFEKIMGRSPSWFDPLVARAYRLRKHLMQPRATLERLLHGPIVAAPPTA